MIIYKITHEDKIYIGRTSMDLEIRRKRHYNRKGWFVYHKEFKIDIIEETNDINREWFWIQTYRDLFGDNLVNKTQLKGEPCVKSRVKRKLLTEDEKRLRKLEGSIKWARNNTEKIKDIQKSNRENNREKINKLSSISYHKNKVLKPRILLSDEEKSFRKKESSRLWRLKNKSNIGDNS